MKEFTIKLTGDIDRYDLSEMLSNFQDFMCDNDIDMEIIKEESK